MALDTNVGNILNLQNQQEFYSAYLYLTFADFYEEQGLKGLQWYVISLRKSLLASFVVTCLINQCFAEKRTKTRCA